MGTSWRIDTTLTVRPQAADGDPICRRRDREPRWVNESRIAFPIERCGLSLRGGAYRVHVPESVGGALSEAAEGGL
jgi:hypothetical protein